LKRDVKGPLHEYIDVEGSNEERQPLGEWWKNHISPNRGEKRANVANFGGPLSWSEVIKNNMQC
jgi:hypothetical protein